MTGRRKSTKKILSVQSPDAGDLSYESLLASADKAMQVIEFGSAIELFNQALNLMRMLPKRDLVKEYALLQKRAYCHRYRTDVVSSLSDLKEMVLLATEMGDIKRQIEAMIQQSEWTTFLGRTSEAREIALEAIALARSSDSLEERVKIKLEADGLDQLGDSVQRAGDSEQIRAYHESALALHRQVGDRAGEAWCLQRIGGTYYQTAQLDQAQVYYRQALQIFREVRDQEHEGLCLNGLGISSQDAAVQRDYYEPALAIFQATGNRVYQVLLLNNLAMLYCFLGLYTRAAHYANQAVQEARAAGALPGLVAFLDTLGLVYFQLGDYIKSRQAIEEALQVARDTTDKFIESGLLIRLGNLDLAEGRLAEAVQILDQAIKLCIETSSPDYQAAAQASLGAAYLALGNWPEAERQTGEAVSQIEALGNKARDYPAEMIWWLRYRILKYKDDPDRSEEAWRCLEQGQRIIFSNITTLSDAGLRRNYLNKFNIHRELLLEWRRQAARRGLAVEMPRTGSTEGNGQSQFKRLLEISVRMNEKRDTKELLDFIMDELVELYGGERSMLMLAENVAELEVAARGVPEKDMPGLRTKAAGLLASLSRSREPLVLKEETGSGEEPDDPPDLNQRSVMVAPLISHSQLIGLIYADTRLIFGAFTQSDLDLLSVFANQAATAIENARWARTLEQRVEQRTSELQAANSYLEQRTAELVILNSVGEAMSRQLDVRTITRLVGDKVRDIFSTEVAVIYLYDPILNMVHAPYAYDRGYIENTEIFDKLLWEEPCANLIITSRKPYLFNTIQEMEEAGMGTYPNAEGGAGVVGSFLGVPIIAGERALGMVSVQSYQEHAYDESNLRLLSTLAAGMGVAIENARLFQETRRLLEESQQRANELAIINTVGQGLARQLEFQAIIDLVGDKIHEIFGGQNCFICLYDRKTSMMQFPYWVGDQGQRIYIEPAPMGTGLTSIVIRSRQPVVLGTTAEADRLGSVKVEDGSGKEPESWMGVPIIVGDEVTGVIALQDWPKNRYTESDVRLASTLASSMGVALENARLLSETRRRVTELSMLSDIGKALSSTLQVNKLLQLIYEQTSRVMYAENLFIALYNQVNDEVEYAFSHNLEEVVPGTRVPVEGGLTGYIIKNRKPVFIHGSGENSALEMGVQVVGKPAASWLGVPMLLGEQVLGAIVVQHYTDSNAYDETHQALLEAVASQAAIALENARLYQEARRRAEEMAALAEIGSDIATTHEMEPVLERMAVRAKELLSVRDIAFYLLQPDQKTLQPNVALGKWASQIKAFPVIVGRGINGSIAQSGIAEMINYPETDPRSILIPGTPDFEEEEQEAIMSAPLISRGKVIGLLCVWRMRAQGLFTQSDLDFLVSLARQAAIAIENARLYVETKRRADQMATLAEAGHEISATLNLQVVFERIASRAHTVCRSRDTILRLADQDGQTFRTIVAVGRYADQFKSDIVTLGHGVSGCIAQSGIAEIIDDIAKDPRGIHVPGTPDVEEEVETLMCAPLVSRGQTIGLMSLYRSIPEGLFTQVDLDFLQGLARQATIAIENARLYQAAQDSQRRMADIIDFLPDAMLVIDREGKVIAWNRAIEEMTGLKAAEILGKGNYEYAIPFYGERRPILIDLVLLPNEEVEGEYANIERHGKILAGESVVQLKGQMAYLYAYASTLRNSDGEIVGAIETIRDFSDRKRAEKELQQAKEEAEEARQQAEAATQAKSAFLATMSHEIRTPMNAIIGMSGLLLNTPLMGEQREFAEIIRTSGDALLTIIDDILDFSKIEAGKLELEYAPFDLRACMENALDLLASKAAEKKLDLALVIAPDTPTMINGDVTRLRQIFLNLLNNAVKFTEQGEVVLSANLETTIPASKNEGRNSPCYILHFSVRDTGIGIPPDRMDRLFKSFSQVDTSTTRRYRLPCNPFAISMRLSQMMGGTMRVESQVGSGTTFHFSIRAEAATVPSRRTELSGEQPQLSGKRLLIVDDNTTNRRIIALQVKDWGMLARDTGSPHEALSWIERGDPLDIAILDMNMPDMDGLMLAREIRKHRDAEELPLVMLSSMGRHETADEAVDWAAYLSKPLKQSQLFDILNAIFSEQPVKPQPSAAGTTQIDTEMGKRLPLRILLAEDNVVNQKLALRLLSQMGYKADVAANGVEAVDAVSSGAYDVVLMDVQMPEMDGLEASRQICARWPWGQRPRIIAMTANAMQGDREICLAAGMDDYISKPIHYEQLAAALNKARLPDRSK
ncbi:MAG: GAF domain-containing protein [Chloroflexi bacterium]|nr:GAF domain-containing protein [Chloroflexota bacterium]